MQRSKKLNERLSMTPRKKVCVEVCHTPTHTFFREAFSLGLSSYKFKSHNTRSRRNVKAGGELSANCRAIPREPTMRLFSGLPWLTGWNPENSKLSG